MRGILFKPAMVQAIIAGTKTQTRRLLKPQPLRTERRYVNWADVGTLHVTQDLFGEGLVFAIRENEVTTRNLGAVNFAEEFAPIKVGSILYVRESFFAYGKWIKRFNEAEQKEEWHFVDLTLENGLTYQYEENPPVDLRKRRTVDTFGWYRRPSLFMPTVASRLFLEVTEVRVEQLRDISSSDAIAEGIERVGKLQGTDTPLWKDYIYDTPYLGSVQSYMSLWDSINGKDNHLANPFVWAYTFKVIDKPL